jgi:hypothetical protein
MRISPKTALSINFFVLMLVSNFLLLKDSDLAVISGTILFGFSVVVFSIQMAVQIVIDHIKAGEVKCAKEHCTSIQAHIHGGYSPLKTNEVMKPPGPE